ncbi:MAG: MBOAT family protein [Lachnospiraceae bacterium]|nr:MBOAT family protein [Lachnospiraceae bacterium]
MDFASFGFIFRFLPIFMFLYFVVPEKMKNLVLFLGSLVFYAWGDRRILGILLMSIVFDYVLGLCMGISRNIWQKRVFLAGGVILNLLIIVSSHQSTWVIPAGSLIYGLQAISYLAEVYRGGVKPQKNILRLGVYVAMFPQMNMGPVVRYRDIEAQLAKRSVDAVRIKDGVIRFIVGLAKKVLLANNICVFWNTVVAANPEDLSTLTAWVGFASFAFKILFDFSGYADMAIGLGQIMGFSFKENFNYPFIATSVKDFWNRWQISLSVWFKDYVYIPLGGGRHGIIRKWLNMLFTWLLIGIWYGVAYHYLLWGLWFFFWMILESSFLGKLLDKLPGMLTRIYTWVIIIISLTFFAADSVPQAWEYIQVLFGVRGVGLVDSMALFSLKSQIILIIIAIFSSMPWAHIIAGRLRSSESGMGMALLRVLEKLLPALLLIVTLAYMAKGY